MNRLDSILIRTYYIVHLDSSQDEDAVSISSFKKRNNELDLISTIEFRSLENALKNIKKNSNITINISGNAVLTRISNNKDEVLFPEIDEEEFHIQKWISDSGLSVQSICRKEYVNSLIEQVQFIKCFITDITLAPATAPYLEGIIHENKLQFDNFSYVFEDSKLTTILETEGKPAKTIFKINNTSYESLTAIGLACLIKYFAAGYSEIDILKEANTQSMYFHKTRTLGIGSFAVIFLLLIINFMIFITTEQKLEEINSFNRGNLTVLNQIVTLQEQLSEYSSLQNNFHKASEYPFSFYCDRFGLLRPSGLWLNSLELCPVAFEQRSNSKVEVDDDLIKITGEVQNPTILNMYIKALKNENWVKDIIMRRYDKHMDDMNAEFVLEILI